MNIISNLVEWNKSLSGWQSFTLSRILQKDELIETDFSELMEVIKDSVDSDNFHSLHDISCTSLVMEVPPRIIIHQIKETNNINAIRNNSNLIFSEQGLTIIYGYNGSGKSGYAKILKKCFSARDTDFKIHGNAFSDKSTEINSVAKIELTIDNERFDLLISPSSNEKNNHIKVFDSRCSVKIIGEKHDFSFITYELGILQRFSDCIDKLRDKFNNEKKKFDTTNKLTFHFKPIEPFYELISQLNENTDLENFKKIFYNYEQEKEIINTYILHLKENDPENKIKILQQHIAIINIIKSKVLGLESSLSAQVIQNLRNKSESYYNNKKLYEESKKIMETTNNFLEGTGGEYWKNLYNDANIFCEHELKIGFHELSVSDKCPLCQQPLEIDAVARIKYFNKYIENRSQKVYEESKALLSADGQRVKALEFNIQIDPLQEEILKIYSLELIQDIESHCKNYSFKRDKLLKACKEPEWSFEISNFVSPILKLELIVEKVSQEILTLSAIIDPIKKKIMEEEIEKFKVKEKLSLLKDEIIMYVTNCREFKKLDKCSKNLNTAFVTSKSKNLVQKNVAEKINELLNDNLKKLSIDKVKISLESKAIKGAAVHSFKINSTSINLSPLEILSEGEQRAIAIASFLTEAELSSPNNPIVLDDPVTSLDHERASMVAKRLALEGQKRQVIIFTHDLLFTKTLMQECEINNAIHKTLYLDRNLSSYEFGIVKDELPISAGKVANRVNKLLNDCNPLSKLDESEYNFKVRSFYTQLRICWERLIEEIIFNGVITRFSTDIQTQRLKQVSFDDEDFFCIEEAMSHCSKYAHDNPDLGNTTPPPLTQLKEDINKLKLYIENKIKLKTEIESTRKKKHC